MKFYYNDKLVRTSKTHEYHYAILSANGDVWSCHGTLEAAQKEFRRPISECETSIADTKKIIAALEKGKTYVDLKVCKRWYRVNLKGKNSDGTSRSEISTWANDIPRLEKRIEFLNTRKIVELEVRA